MSLFYFCLVGFLGFTVSPKLISHFTLLICLLVMRFFILCRADMFSESQRIKYDIETETREIPDARAYLLKLKEIRTR